MVSSSTTKLLNVQYCCVLPLQAALVIDGKVSFNCTCAVRVTSGVIHYFSTCYFFSLWVLPSIPHWRKIFWILPSPANQSSAAGTVAIPHSFSSPLHPPPLFFPSHPFLTSFSLPLFFSSTTLPHSLSFSHFPLPLFFSLSLVQLTPGCHLCRRQKWWD